MPFIRDGGFQSILQKGEVNAEDTKPSVIDENTVKLGGLEINVKATVYSEAKANEIVEGWEQLQKHVAMDTLFQALFMRTLSEFRLADFTRLEPIILELVRLCYWYNRCTFIDHGNTFHFKEGEIKGKLTADVANIEKFRTTISQVGAVTVKEDGRLLDDSYRKAKKELAIGLWSIVPELRIAALASETGRKVSFHETHDLIIDGIICEVYTPLDQIEIARDGKGETDIFYHGTEAVPPTTLHDEMLAFIKRTKIEREIQARLNKGAGIVFVDATHTSTSKFMNEKTSSNDSTYSAKFALEEAISKKKAVVIIGCAIECLNKEDFDCIYRITCYSTKP